MMEVGVVKGTPPSTPSRHNSRRTQYGSPKVSSSRRRSLFREESDLSDISPLSPSSEDKTPRKKTPKKGDSTPLKGVNGLSSLSLDSPKVRVHSDGIRVRGISALNKEAVGSIPPCMFYGSRTEPRPPPIWIRKEVSKAKTKLFLDDLPRDRKRARTSSGQKIQPSAKKQRRSVTGHSPRTPLTPIPTLGRNNSLPQPKKKSPSNQKKKSLLFQKQKEKGFVECDDSEGNNENAYFIQTKDFVTTEKDIEEIVGQEIIRRAKKRDSDKERSSMVGNWEVSFTKESRLKECRTSSSDPSRKFFKSQGNTTPRMIRRPSSALTPPWSSHKRDPSRRKSLCKPNYVFSPAKLSPNKASPRTTPLRRSPRKSPNKQKQLDGLIKSFSKDLVEMMEDETNEETKDEVTKLIQHLNQNDCSNEWSSALPSPEEDVIEEEEPKTPAKPDTKSPNKVTTVGVVNGEDKLYPIFRSSNKATLLRSPIRNPQSSIKKKVRKYFGFGEDQYQIDSGQDSLREVHCKDCGMFYSKGCPEDEIIHNKHHAQCFSLAYSGWKKERIIGTMNEGKDKVVSILKDDPKSWWTKVKDVIEIVDYQLGFPQVSIDCLRYPQIFLYVKDGKEVAGCLVAEQITFGHKLLSLEQDVDLCSEESYPAKCGISRIWVNSKYRRSSIATCLVNALRVHFAYGVVLRKEDLAFTVPTDDGKKFISHYMGQKTGYLVYT